MCVCFPTLCEGFLNPEHGLEARTLCVCVCVCVCVFQLSVKAS